MTKLEKLRALVEETLGKMRALLDLGDAESRDLTDEETEEYDGFDKSVIKANKEIDRLVRLEDAEAAAAVTADKPHKPNFKARTHRYTKDFENLGEFVCAVTFDRNDPRLADVEYQEFDNVAGARNDMSMGTGTEGGFAIPEQFKPELLQVKPDEAAFRPRATVIPAGDPPDAKITMPALDQTSAQNVYGGVVMYKVGEGVELTETNVRLKQVSLEPQGLGGYIQLTNKVIRNWRASGPLVAKQLRSASIGFEDTQFYNGNGIAGPLGILSAPARIEVTRATASSIAIADIRNMYARIKMGGSFVWIASQTTLPQLMQLAGGNSENIFVFDASRPVPNSLLGIPLIFKDRSVTLGTKGDLVLADLSYYLVKDGSGPFIATSEHVAFLNDITTIKLINNVDGKPWLSAPLPLEGSTSNTVSPFVVLK